ncbi:unnamed protein product [Pieris macdunnoughi]|uniref:Uncharacterized protein n=1 Tax=Pieris macdunnoughi TaxID=345717 RepID=A0A821XQQ2_9NEOP|nr:unnamed protein product [Pieris macdunnoughi]
MLTVIIGAYERTQHNDKNRECTVNSQVQLISVAKCGQGYAFTVPCLRRWLVAPWDARHAISTIHAKRGHPSP